MIPAADARAYARLLLEAGVNLQPGQCLSLGAEPIHWPLLNEIAALAYEMGAKFVQVDAPHPALTAARVKFGADEFLGFVPDYLRARSEETATADWARLRLAGQEEPQLFADLPGAKLAAISRAERAASKAVMRAAQADKLPWCVAAAPTPGWAAQVFETQPTEAAEAQLWEAMRRILRLDQPDPVATWQQLADTLRARCSVLNSFAFDAIHLHSATTGTDLKVGLHPGGHWLGGGSNLPDGRRFIANLPTEEVFTTPDYRRTEGRLVVTRPVDVLGKEVRGARFVFSAGKVIEAQAEAGQDALHELLELDSHAPFAGELALVDNASPIYQSGLTFHNILFDENATCHLALGSAYPKAVPGAENWDESTRLERGINESLAHTDFMFGCEDLEVSGLDSSGNITPILRAGRFVI